MHRFDLAALTDQTQQLTHPYLEFLRVAPLSAGVYFLAAGATDTQRPHTEDELYVILRGSGMLRVGDEDAAVAAGSAVFVPARVAHRFHSITEDLAVLVIFAPAEYSQAPARS